MKKEITVVNFHSETKDKKAVNRRFRNYSIKLNTFKKFYIILFVVQKSERQKDISPVPNKFRSELSQIFNKIC